MVLLSVIAAVSLTSRFTGSGFKVVVLLQLAKAKLLLEKRPYFWYVFRYAPVRSKPVVAILATHA